MDNRIGGTAKLSGVARISPNNFGFNCAGKKIAGSASILQVS
jgi:hypothetical protein